MITKEELDQITDALIEELREMPDGTRTATAWLMAENGYDTAYYNWEDLYEMMKLSEEEGIVGGCLAAEKEPDPALRVER